MTRSVPRVPRPPLLWLVARQGHRSGFATVIAAIEGQCPGRSLGLGLDFGLVNQLGLGLAGVYG